MKHKKIGRPVEIAICECGKQTLKVYAGTGVSRHRIKSLHYCPNCDIIFRQELVKFKIENHGK